MPNPASTGTVTDASAEAEGVGPDADLQAAFALGLGERRRWPRFPAELECTIFTGRHVHEGVLRNVSPGGAMLRNVPGLVADDLVLVRLARHPELAFHARVRAVSLIGTHLAIEGAADQVNWQDAVLEDAA
jgi:hypothetical protein